MIITVAGKPFSGKSEVVKYLSIYHGFTAFYGGKMFRAEATKRGLDILELNRLQDTSIDEFVDKQIEEIGKRDADKNVAVDSRTAWHFIPHSFKVFLDVDEEVQISRMLLSKRNDEKTDLSIEDAKASVNERWNLENERYMAFYGFDNNDLSQFDFVLNNSRLTIEETAEAVYEAYLKFEEEQLKKNPSRSF